MQYYRLWIYSCNSVLGVTSAIFTVFAAFVLADVRLSLAGVELYHPTFLYAYAALILQCGVVQTIGCLGAQRLSHKLLSIYWILLLLLTIGDVVVGLVWVYKLDKVKLSLQKEVLTKEFKQKYSIDASFTYSWNKVQSEEHCCGVDGPSDYNKSNGSSRGDHILVPSSCCTFMYLPPDLDETRSPKYTFPNQNHQQHGHHRHHHHHQKLNGHQYNDVINLTNSGSLNVSDINGSEVSVSHNASTLPTFLLTSNTTIVTHSGNSSPSDGVEDDGTMPTSSAVFNTNLLNSNNNNIGVRHKPRHSGHRRKIPIPGSGQGGSVSASSSSSYNSGSGASSGSSVENQTSPERVVYKVNLSPTGESVRGPSSPSIEAINIPSPWSCQNHLLVQHSTLDPSSKRRDDKDEGDGEYKLMNSQVDENKSSLSSSSTMRRRRGEGDRVESTHSNNIKKYRVYPLGCQIKLIEWVDHVSGIMFILGFCIIGFIKVCFLVILRYEIREMIEKINILEIEAPISPSRNFQIGGNGRGEYGKIGGSATGTSGITSNFSGVTIKSPQGTGNGDGGGGSNFCRNDRSTSHSQETVNMTLLISTPRMNPACGHMGGGGGLDPNPKGRELKQFRSHSQGSPFLDYNIDPQYFADVEHEDDHNVLIRIPNTTNNPVKTVKKDLSFSSCSSVAQPQTNRSGFHHQVSSENNSDICELLLASVDVENFAYEEEASGQGQGQGGEGVNWKQGNKSGGYNESSPGTTPYRRNGNNNIKTSNSFTLALLGTAV